MSPNNGYNEQNNQKDWWSAGSQTNSQLGLTQPLDLNLSNTVSQLYSDENGLVKI